MNKLLIVLICLFLATPVYGKVIQESNGATVVSVNLIPDAPAGAGEYQDYIVVTYSVTYDGKELFQDTRTSPVGAPEGTAKGIVELFNKIKSNGAAIKAQMDADIAEWTN